MPYTISEAAKKINVTASALRYYDKEGLLPFIERKESGIRTFSESDMQWLDIIECLKSTGMPIKDIKQFIDWCIKGDETLRERYEMFLERKEIVQAQIAALQKTLDTIDYKCWYYKTAVEAGSVTIHQEANPRETYEQHDRHEYQAG